MTYGWIIPGGKERSDAVLEPRNYRDVPCPKCGAKKVRRCLSLHTGNRKKRPCKERVQAAKGALKAVRMLNGEPE